MINVDSQIQYTNDEQNHETLQPKPGSNQLYIATTRVIIKPILGLGQFYGITPIQGYSGAKFTPCVHPAPQEFIKMLIFCEKNKYSTEQLKGVIELLRKLCPTDVSIDKVKAMLGNTGTLAGEIDENHQTVQYSKEQLLEYTQMTGQN